MANGVLFVGGRLDSVIIDAGVVSEVADGTYCDLTWSDSCIYVNPDAAAHFDFFDPDSAPLLVPADVTGGQTLYLHYEYSSTNSNLPGIYLVDSAGHPWVAIGGNNWAHADGVDTTRTWLFVNTGTGAAPVWTIIGSTPSNFHNQHRPVDIRLDIDAAGVAHYIMLAINETKFIEGTFASANLVSLRGVQLKTSSVDLVQYFSQLIATRGISTVSAHVDTSRPTGGGIYDDWSGSYTDVNEPVTDDSSVNQTINPDQKQTYPMGNLTVPAGYNIAGVFHWIRAKNDGGTPENIKGIARVSGADYTTANLTGLGVTFASIGVRYDLNPATGLPWTDSDWNGHVELGYESAA